MKLTFVTALILALSWSAEAKDRLPFIDMHMHAHGVERFGSAAPPNPVTGKPSAAVTDEVLVRASLAEMKRYNIVKAVACGATSRQQVSFEAAV